MFAKMAIHAVISPFLAVHGGFSEQSLSLFVEWFRKINLYDDNTEFGLEFLIIRGSSLF